jgi:CelD/BcsL family acetyltransferase involved in cellulose biosynthesis
MKIEKIKSIHRFKEIRDTWNGLLYSCEHNSIFLTHQWFYSWWRWLSQGKSLEILLFRNRSGTPVGIAPLMSEKDILCFMASREVTDYCDFIIGDGKEEEFFEALLDFFRAQYPETHKISLINLKQTSKTLLFLPQLAAKYDFSCTVSESEVAPVLSLPASHEDFLAHMSRKNRHDLKRKLRRMEELEGTKMVRIVDAVGLQNSVSSFIQLHRRSDASKEEFWQAQGMADFFREIVIQFSPRGWVELFFLEHDENIIAALLNFIYEDQILFYNVAYNKDYAWYSPGLLLFHQRLKEAIQEGKKEADFLRGREKYKYYFGAKESKIFDLTLETGA